MGSAFRNYGGGGGYRYSWRSSLTPGIRMLLIANGAVYCIQTLVLFLGGGDWWGWMVHVFGLVPLAVTNGLRVWQPVTYMFLHGGIWHILLNMLVLWMFGQDLERTWGTRRFYIYYFITGVGAGLINVLVKTALDPRGLGPALIPTIGASGAIYGLLMAAAILFPDRRVWLILPPVELPMRVFVFIMGAIEFFGTIEGSGDNVSHITHLSGMLVGYLYLRRGSFLYTFRNSFLDWKRQRARRKFEVYDREHRNEPPSRPDQWLN
ncbi:MAG: rhomboid family intramembrane serine protease [Acidobacteria bacterium]|nr:rhomboid family intramembrane serine protease [Acidobacteriota bacterium]